MIEMIRFLYESIEDIDNFIVEVKERNNNNEYDNVIDYFEKEKIKIQKKIRLLKLRKFNKQFIKRIYKNK